MDESRVGGSSGGRLLSRNEFKDGVFRRDSNRCVRCGCPAADAHHLLERRLFSNGGYYLANGVSLCSACHLDAERTHVSPRELRALAGIAVRVLPAGFPEDRHYDKWGNPYLKDGRRQRGPLFHEEAVQKVLRESGFLSEFAWEIPVADFSSGRSSAGQG